MRRLRIVIADDEENMREYLLRLLPRLGHEVVAAVENGQALVAACFEHRPDLVVTDVSMPELDGIDAALALRDVVPAPVILISAHQDPEVLARASAAGVRAFLTKPVKRADLDAAITAAAAGLGFS